MADYHHNPLDSSAQPIEAMPDQPSANALALKLRNYRHGSQGHRWKRFRGCLNPHPAEEDVPGDPSFNFGNKGSEHHSLTMQTINQIGFVPPPKRLLVYETDSGAIFRFFTSDEHIVVRVHKLRYCSFLPAQSLRAYFASQSCISRTTFSSLL
jgi:hypothetical protein